MKKKASVVASMAILAVLGSGSALAVGASLGAGQDDKVGRLPAVISPEAAVTPVSRPAAGPHGDDERPSGTASPESERHDDTAPPTKTRPTSGTTTERDRGTEQRNHGSFPGRQHDD